jgi:hypothetical protein
MIDNTIIFGVSNLTGFHRDFVQYFLEDDTYPIPRMCVLETREALDQSIASDNEYERAKCLCEHCRSVKTDLETNCKDPGSLQELHSHTHDLVPQKDRVARVLSYCNGNTPERSVRSTLGKGGDLRNSFAGIIDHLSFVDSETDDLIRLLSKQVRKKFNFDPDILKDFFQAVAEIIKAQQ